MEPADDGREIFPMGEEHDLTSEPIHSGERDLAPAAPKEEPKPQGPWWKQYENQEVEYTAYGKAVKEPLAAVIQRAQRAYNYPQLMEQYNKSKAELDLRTKELSSDAEIAEAVKHARSDTAWAEHVRDSWTRRNEWQQNATSDPAAQRIMQLEAKLNPMVEKLTKFEQAELERTQKIENEELDKEIASVKAEHSKYGIDLASIDPSTGLSMESTVVNYAAENGINSFKTAFMAVYGDKLWSQREEALKSQWAKEQAQRQKDGFIGRTSTPTQGPRRVQNVSQKSWEDVGEEAKQAVRSGQYK